MDDKDIIIGQVQYELNYFSFIYIILLIVGLAVKRLFIHWLINFIIFDCEELVDCYNLDIVGRLFEC